MKRKIEPFSNGPVRLRLIEKADLPQTLAWRNRDDARVWFKTSDKLTLEQHQTWFDRYSTKDDDFLFVVEAEDKPVGQAAIYNIDWQQGSAEIGRFLAAPGYSGRGYISLACDALLKIGFSALHLHNFFLEVLENNSRAIQLYERHGFHEDRRYNGLIRMVHTINSTGKQ